jgi:hypothetical protein
MVYILTRIGGGPREPAGVACGPTFAIIAAVASAATSLAGGMIQAKGARAAGRAQQQAQYYEAAQREQQAQEQRAAAQRVLLETRKKTERVQSTLQARAAASGAGATDPTVLGLGEDIAGQGEYEGLMAMYKGENAARGIQDQAIGDRLTGDAALKAGKNRATGAILSGVGGMFDSLGKIGAKV